MKRYLKKTWKNKLVSMVIVTLGVVSTIPDGDGTALLICWIFGIPLFFAKENYIV